MSIRPRGVALVAGLAWLVASTHDAWATPSAQLVYARDVGAERCPDAAAFRKAVASRLGFDPFFPYAKQTIVAEVSAGKKGFYGRYRILDGLGQVRGERAIDSESDDCAETIRAMALGVSIAVDDLEIEPHDATPAAASPPPASPPSEPQPTAASPPPREPPLAAPATMPRDSSTPRPGQDAVAYEVRAGMVGSVGTAPTVAFGASTAFGVRWRALGVAIEGRFHPKTTAAVEGGGVWSSLAMGTAAVCANAVIPFICALGSLGEFRGGGSDIASPRSGGALFGAVGVRIGVHASLSQALYAHAHADAAYALTPTRIAIEGRAAYEMPPVSGTVGIGAGVRF